VGGEAGSESCARFAGDAHLRKAGWRVLRVWECDLARKNWPRVARRVVRALQSEKSQKSATRNAAGTEVGLSN
jgi:G:T-mismatch repair DNA endonuclease (very short patch repair protein)